MLRTTICVIVWEDGYDAKSIEDIFKDIRPIEPVVAVAKVTGDD